MHQKYLHANRKQTHSEHCRRWHLFIYLFGCLFSIVVQANSERGKCLSIHSSVCLCTPSVCLSIYVSICLSIFLSIYCSSVYLLYLSISLSISLFVYLLCLFVCPSVSLLCLSLSIRRPACLPVCLSTVYMYM